jgi:hypothetical protein
MTESAPSHNPLTSCRPVTSITRLQVFAVLCLLAAAAAAAQPEPPLSARTPLIDAVARAETDGYARLDEVVERSAALPDVFDPALYDAAGDTSEIRNRLLAHLLWLRGREASHLQQIESLPRQLEEVATDEPYHSAFVALYAESTPERYARVKSIYQAEISTTEHLLAFVEQIEAGHVRPTPAGFTFEDDSAAAEYRETVALLNQVYRAQDLRISEYYAWEIRQKAALREFRDQL